MNERIRLLADHAKAYANQCTKDLDGDIAWHWMDYYTEKFAELIVAECAEVCYLYNAAGGADTAFVYGYKDCGDDIKQHFGVEE